MRSCLTQHKKKGCWKRKFFINCSTVKKKSIYIYVISVKTSLFLTKFYNHLVISIPQI